MPGFKYSSEWHAGELAALPLVGSSTPDVFQTKSELDGIFSAQLVLQGTAI